MGRFHRTAIASAMLFWQCGISAADGPLRFDDFPAAEAYQGRNAPLVLGKDDRQFRTRLRTAAKEPPNFAKHYILTAWGCGTECLVSVIIDANTGRFYWAPHTICCWPIDVPNDFSPIEARIDSRLIIFHGERNEKDGDDAAH
jgi:hypothetical protein